MLSGAVCFLLTAGGLALAGVHGYRRRWRRATRWAAAALLPAGLYLTGLVTVGSTIGHAVGDWAVKLVFDPGVWVGVGLLGLAALLLLLSRLGSGSGGPEEVAGGPQPGRAQAPAAPARPAVAPARPAQPTRAKAGEDLGDFSDIEEILRKRGI